MPQDTKEADPVPDGRKKRFTPPISISLSED